jgi:hypothetical protein
MARDYPRYPRQLMEWVPGWGKDHDTYERTVVPMARPILQRGPCQGTRELKDEFSYICLRPASIPIECPNL